MLCCVMYVMLYYAVLCCGVLWYAMLYSPVCYVMLCYEMLLCNPVVLKVWPLMQPELLYLGTC